MKILAMDIGLGTQDILLYDSNKNYENMCKLVFSSPTQRFADRLRQLSKRYNTIVIYGYTIGGGPSKFAILDLLKQQRRVIITEKAALTVTENLDELQQLGAEIIDDGDVGRYLKQYKESSIELKEIDFKTLREIFNSFNEEISDIDAIAVAVQDHGIPSERQSHREFRFNVLKESLLKGGRAQDFSYTLDKIPSFLKRMISIANEIKNTIPNVPGIIMDTAPATLFGIMYDEYLTYPDIFLGVNVGNGHTLAAVFEDKRAVAFFEHHTRLLNPQKIEFFLNKFIDGELTFENVFGDEGHGALYAKKIPRSEIKDFFGIGPNRFMLRKVNLKFKFPAPMGDVMMAGPITLSNVAKEVLKL